MVLSAEEDRQGEFSVPKLGGFGMTSEVKVTRRVSPVLDGASFCSYEQKRTALLGPHRWDVPSFCSQCGNRMDKDLIR